MADWCSGKHDRFSIFRQEFNSPIGYQIQELISLTEIIYKTDLVEKDGDAETQVTQVHTERGGTQVEEPVEEKDEDEG